MKILAVLFLGLSVTAFAEDAAPEYREAMAPDAAQEKTATKKEFMPHKAEPRLVKAKKGIPQACETPTNEMVICNGNVYRRERGGVIQQSQMVLKKAMDQQEVDVPAGDPASAEEAKQAY